MNGVDLWRLSLAALPPDRIHLAYFLPRNLNGLTLAQHAYACGVRGCLELEQNILNGKLKTITVYLQPTATTTTVPAPNNTRVATGNHATTHDNNVSREENE